jgi:hypothetical protein
MATPKKPSNRPKSRSTSSSAGKKKPATRKKTSAASSKSTGSTRKAPAKRSPSASTRKAPAKTARKTAPKSGTKARAKAAAAAVPEIAVPPRKAADVKAEATTPSLRPGRRRSWGRWAAIAALLAAVVVVIVVIAGGGDDDNTTVADTNPATTPTVAVPSATATSPAVTTPSAAAPAAAKPVVRTEKCDPIIGSGTANSGKTYDVTSSAKDGDPADCTEAHSILLSALSGSGTTSDWNCKTDPSGSPIATCTSTGGRSIQASG